MAYQPIESSGIAYAFNNYGGTVTLSSSVVSTAGPNTNPLWGFTTTLPQTFRVTANAYNAGQHGGTIASANYFFTPDQTQANTAAVVGQPLPVVAFTPSPIVLVSTSYGALDYAGMDMSGSGGGAEGAGPWTGETFSFLVEVDVPAFVCDEVGYTTKANVSAYQRNREFVSRLMRNEKRCLVANFNGAISAARSIVSATWRCDQYTSVVMSQAQCTTRTASVLIDTPQAGYARLKCEVTLDNGEIYNQLFRVEVRGSPYFNGETYPTGTGPQVLTAVP